jgi:hypothetical protein
MANTQAMCNSFKREILDGLHAFGVSVIRGATTKDSFKAALFLAFGSLNKSTTSYTSVTGSEVSGAGYSAGGIAVTNGTDPALSSDTAIWQPSASLVYTSVTLSTAFDTVLIYNDTSAGKLAVAVYVFGSQTVTAGTFTLTMPALDASNALLRIA